jgi:hypothetical protein
MYYEEKIINGILHYRTDQDREFKAMTREEITIRYMVQSNAVEDLELLLSDILKEYCGVTIDDPEYYETERNSEAQAVMFLEKIGTVEIIEGTWPETRKIKFRFE